MSHSRLLLPLLFASCTFSFAAACASPTDDGGASPENAESQDNDLKKKVKPKGGNGAFDLVAPSFNTAGFAGAFTFDDAPIKPGERSEKVPGTYVLQALGGGFADGQPPNQQLSFPITAGVVSKHQLGALRVRYSKPVTLGAAQIELRSETGYTGYLYAARPWQSAPLGASLLVLAGKIVVTPATEGVAINVAIAENKLEEVVLPTSTVSLLIDAYDPDYPTPSCQPTYVTAGAQGFTANANVRKPDGSPNASFVVPQGTRAPVYLNAYGVIVSQPTVAGGTNTFQLNRLEIDDVEVAKAGGGSQLIKGTVSISRKNPDGSFTSFNCGFPTHSGIDLPDGTYRVVSRAQSASGVVTSTEDVTFP